MLIETIYLRSFRNLLQQEVPLLGGVNLVYGKTGQGKSSFLEALSLLIFGASFRTHFIREAIAFHEKSFFIEAKTNHSGVEGYVALGYDGLKRHVLINKKEVTSTKELLGKILGVSASLSDLELIAGPPALRRRYLDEQIAEVDPIFVDHLMKANRALMQRNALLKEGALSQLPVWDDLFARSSSYVIRQRMKTASELIPFILYWFEQFSALCPLMKGIEIRFRSQAPESEEDLFSWLKGELSSKKEKELLFRKTLVGHHRDDFFFSYHGAPLKQVLSLGQLRMMCLSIRLAEWSLLAERRAQEKPLFLLDDVDGTLDQELQRQILEILPLLGQVVVSSHSDWSLPSRRLRIEAGCVKIES